jgi:hypothetical protein
LFHTLEKILHLTPKKNKVPLANENFYAGPQRPWQYTVAKAEEFSIYE